MARSSIKAAFAPGAGEATMLGEMVTNRQYVADPWTYIDEVTHRTLNVYTAMVASVQYAAMQVRDPSSRGILEKVADNLRAQARAQSLLRPPRGADNRRLDVDLEALCAALSATILSERGIELTFFCDPVALDARRAWQIRLIVSELVMNAVRHAFGESQGGAIAVEIRHCGQTLRCMVSDNGSATVAPAPGGGTTIVDGLVMDLDGQVSRVFGASGSAICVQFPSAAEVSMEALVIP
jgi:two-component sensor histidine kinase